MPASLACPRRVSLCALTGACRLVHRRLHVDIRGRAPQPTAGSAVPDQRRARVGVPRRNMGPLLAERCRRDAEPLGCLPERVGSVSFVDLPQERGVQRWAVHRAWRRPHEADDRAPARPTEARTLLREQRRLSEARLAANDRQVAPRRSPDTPRWMPAPCRARRAAASGRVRIARAWHERFKGPDTRAPKRSRMTGERRCASDGSPSMPHGLTATASCAEAVEVREVRRQVRTT